MHQPLSLTFKIEQPCRENWDAMMGDGAERFCAHCQKTVTDLTDFSDTELLAFFRAHTGIFCGRIRQNHLTIDAPPVEVAAQRSRSLVPVAATLLTLNTLTTHAGSPVNPLPIHPLEQRFVQQPVTGTPADTLIISGTLRDNASRPLAGAEIRCGTTTLQADKNGYFEWKIPAIGAKPMLLRFSYGHFPEQVRNYHPVMGSTRFDVILEEMNCAVTMGMIVIERRLPDSLSLLQIEKAGKLDRKTKAFLGQLALALRSNPGMPLRLIALSKLPVLRAKKQVEVVINYLVEQEGISPDRLQAELPMHQKECKWELQLEFISAQGQ